MTQRDLADLLGWHQTDIARIEAGLHAITVVRLCTLASGLETSGSELLRSAEDSVPE